MQVEHDGLPREKHWDAIGLFDNEEIIAQRRELENSFQRGNEVIYCRPTDVGLKCISTRIDENNALGGIIEEGTKSDFYFGKRKKFNRDGKYKNKPASEKIDPEEKRFEAWLIRNALCNNLRLSMPKDSANLLFVNSQWRFEKLNDEEKKLFANEKGRQYLDILAFDIDSGHFVVVELKKANAKDRGKALQQAQIYCNKLERHANEFSGFFLAMLKGMIKMYVDSPTEQKKLTGSLAQFEKNGSVKKFVPCAIEPIGKITAHGIDVQIGRIQ